VAADGGAGVESAGVSDPDDGQKGIEEVGRWTEPVKQYQVPQGPGAKQHAKQRNRGSGDPTLQGPSGENCPQHQDGQAAGNQEGRRQVQRRYLGIQDQRCR